MQLTESIKYLHRSRIPAAFVICFCPYWLSHTWHVVHVLTVVWHFLLRKSSRGPTRLTNMRFDSRFTPSNKRLQLVHSLSFRIARNGSGLICTQQKRLNSLGISEKLSTVPFQSFLCSGAFQTLLSCCSYYHSSCHVLITAITVGQVHCDGSFVRHFLFNVAGSAALLIEYA